MRGSPFFQYFCIFTQYFEGNEKEAKQRSTSQWMNSFSIYLKISELSFISWIIKYYI